MEKHRSKMFSNGFELSSSQSSSLIFEVEEGEIEIETETESCKTVTRRRSKRTRKPSSSLVQFHVQHCKLIYDDFGSYCSSYEDDDVDRQMGSCSSISEVTSEEDVAFCLMMLSRDRWNSHVHGVGHEIECDKIDLSHDKVICDLENTGFNKSPRKKYYKCDTCDKVFRSYQALGGHRASHKKARVSIIEHGREEDEGNSVVAVVKEKEVKKVHECPICFRVFASGQALGGHKRSHVSKSTGGVIENVIKSKVIVKNHKKMKTVVVENLIDLNLPAAVDDEDGEEEEEEEEEKAISDVYL